ncbi:hypothetical protein ABIA24_001630 [Sinorhizobium fredii]
MAALSFKLLLAAATVATSIAAPTGGFSQDFDIYIGRTGPRYHDEYPPRRYYRENYPEEYQCTTRQALHLARRYLRNPRIGRTSNSAIEVRGIGRRGERNRVVFGADPGCPRID